MRRKLLQDAFLIHASHGGCKRKGRTMVCPKCKLRAVLSKFGLTISWEDCPIEVTVIESELIPQGGL